MVTCEPEIPTTKQYIDAFLATIEEYKLSAKLILLTFDSEFDDDQPLEHLPENVVVIKNITRALNRILLECFENCPEKKGTTHIIEVCKQVVRFLSEKELLLKEMPSVFANLKLGDSLLSEDYVTSVYLMLKFVKENLGQIQQALENVMESRELLDQIKKVDWSRANEIEQFLVVFYETNKEFSFGQEPMFQKVSSFSTSPYAASSLVCD